MHGTKLPMNTRTRSTSIPHPINHLCVGRAGGRFGTKRNLTSSRSNHVGIIGTEVNLATSTIRRRHDMHIHLSASTLPAACCSTVQLCDSDGDTDSDTERKSKNSITVKKHESVGGSVGSDN